MGKHDKHKTPYTGATINCDGLWDSAANDYVSDQAFIDASYAIYVGADGDLVGSDRGPVVNGTTQNYRTGTFGQMCYQGGFDQHPPSAANKAAADAYVAWWKSQHA